MEISIIPKNAVILGGRDIDELELPNIKDAGVTLISTKDIQKYGVEAMFKKSNRNSFKWN